MDLPLHLHRNPSLCTKGNLLHPVVPRKDPKYNHNLFLEVAFHGLGQDSFPAQLGTLWDAFKMSSLSINLVQSSLHPKSEKNQSVCDGRVVSIAALLKMLLQNLVEFVEHVGFLR